MLNIIFVAKTTIYAIALFLVIALVMLFAKQILEDKHWYSAPIRGPVYLVDSICSWIF